MISRPTEISYFLIEFPGIRDHIIMTDFLRLPTQFRTPGETVSESLCHYHKFTGKADNVCRMQLLVSLHSP